MKISKQNYLKSLEGYKLIDGHFELGSNLHIDNYFYAKRMFYNSFYTNRFAFLIADHIISNCWSTVMTAISGKNDGNSRGITLLGYENYSDLLVSNVRKMLNDYLKYYKFAKKDVFNHDVFTKEKLFLKNPDKISEHIFLIFPISTTFSTSVKIQNEIRELLSPAPFARNVMFHSPVINCLVIANDNLEKDRDWDELLDIEGAFGWKSFVHSERKIQLHHLDNMYIEHPDAPPALVESRHQIFQRYFISLKTKWEAINKCPKCYPIKVLDEECLIETKANSITPNLIFGYPKTFHNSEEKNIFTLFNIRQSGGQNEPVVYRRHFKKHKNHYIYYIRVGRFLTDNNKDIRNWLEKKCAVLHSLKEKNVVIVTPTLGSNSGFTNLLNDVIFSDVATIIQYNPDEEFLQNFKLFYADILKKAHSVIYVDDVLATTKTISEINFFVENARDFRSGIDYSVCLINRIGYYDNLKLTEKLAKGGDGDRSSRMLSYVHTHVPPIAHRDKYPYVSLVEKFTDLSSKSVLDSMRIHFLEKVYKFRPFDLTRDFNSLSDFGKPKALLQFLMVHEFMKVFTIISVVKKESYLFHEVIRRTFEEISENSYQHILDFFEERPNSSIKSFKIHYPEFDSEIKHALYKICSSEPYAQHRKIKSAVFHWVIRDLELLVKEINLQKKLERSFFETRDQNTLLRYSRLDDFKFLLKRGAKLKVNYIYSTEVLKAIGKVIEAIAEVRGIFRFKQKSLQTTIIGQESNEKVEVDPVRSRAYYPNEFMTYYVGLLQELIIEHESKALQVVMNVKSLIDADSEKKTLKNTSNNHFMQLLRLLVLENTFIFYTSRDKFLEKIGVDLSFADRDFSEFFRKVDSFHRTYPFKYNRLMLSRFEKISPEKDYDLEAGSVDSFKYMLVLKSILNTDYRPGKKGKTILIEEKLNRIVELCCEILNIKNGGGYFAVKYKNREGESQKEDVAIVGQFSNKVSKSLNPNYFSGDSFLFRMFEGLSENSHDHPLSTFEVSFDEEGLFHFRDLNTLKRKEVYSFSEFQDTLFKNMFFLRITEITQLPDSPTFTAEPQAVLCFYDHPLSEDAARKFSQRQDEILRDESAQTSISFSGESQRKSIYERFDPKKIRQLLLLRNDLSDFINHHMNNDSLRAYIEMINNNKYSISLNHGVTVYESLVETYIEKIKNAHDREELKEYSDSLKTVFSYLTNKMHLIAMANEDHLKNPQSLEEEQEPYSLGQLVAEFIEAGKFIFMLEQSDMKTLKSLDLVEFDYSTISRAELETEFLFSDSIAKEMVFEILYNIKKHAIYDNFRKIDDDNKLEVKFYFERDANGDFLSIVNNFSLKMAKYVRKLSDGLSRKKGTDGLNLIYNIINKKYNRKITLEGYHSFFTVRIQLRTIEEINI